MNIFDLLFLFCVLATAAAFSTALVRACMGEGRRALAILRAWSAAAVVYLAADLVSIALTPVRVLHLHDPECSDDWCFAVENAGRDAPGSDIYRVGMKLWSRALRVDQRERGLKVYLTGLSGRRYDPVPQVGDVPFDTLLRAGESVAAARAFRVPADERTLDLLVVHEGGFPIGKLILGRSPFDRRTVVRLDGWTARMGADPNAQ